MTLKPTLVMLKILQKYCHLNFIHVPEEILHKNIFWVSLYSSWKTASCGLGIQMYWRNQNYMSGEDLKWPVWSVTVYIHLIYIWLFESLYSWMCTVYMLHKVNLLEGFFSLNLFFFFLNYCQKQGEQPWGGTENMWLLDLVLPSQCHCSLTMNWFCKSVIQHSKFYIFFLIAFVHVTNWYKCLQ